METSRVWSVLFLVVENTTVRKTSVRSGDAPKVVTIFFYGESCSIGNFKLIFGRTKATVHGRHPRDVCLGDAECEDAEISHVSIK